MNHIGEIIKNNSITIEHQAEDRKKLAYEISAYFNEPVYQWFRHFKDSGVFTSFIRVYFEEAKQANKPKKTQAKFLMKKLFPQGKKNML